MSEPTDKPPRGVTNLRIKFRSANLDEFIERYAVDVSRGGIFIRTREPLSVGSRLKLDFQLLDAAPLLSGEGTVVWIRQPDPARAEVTPGMGVRFDKLSDDSQQRLEKILAEKDRLGQTGKAPGMTKSGAGIAVRRPTGAFMPLDTSPSKAPPPVEVKTAPAEVKPTTAAEAPRPSGPFSTLGRPTAGFGRPRSTTGALSPLRSAPVPSALFEQPTSDDIDKALSVLEEKSGPVPAMPPPPRLAPSAPLPISDDGSNEPTRVVNDPSEFGVHEAVTGTGASIVPESGAPEGPVSLADDRTARADLDGEEVNDSTMAASPAAFAAAEKVLAGSSGTPDRKPGSLEPASSGRLAAGNAASEDDGDMSSGAPESTMPGGFTGPLRKKAIIVEGASPMESGRFRTSDTYQRPRKTGKWVVLGLVLAAAGGGGYAFRGRLRTLFPAQEVANAPAPGAPERKPALIADAAAAADGALAAAPAPAGEEKAAATVPKPAPAPKEEKPAPEPPKAVAQPAAAEAKPAPTESPRPGKKKRRAGAGAAAAEAAAGGGTPAEGEKKPAAEGGEAAATPPPSGGAAETPPAAAAPPILRIVTTPSGAEVLIDGASVGKTPLAIQGVDPSATHALTLKKDGYEPAERSVATVDWTQGKAGATAKVTIKLKKVGAEAPKDEAKKPDVEILTPD